MDYVTIAAQPCGSEGYLELRVAFGDLHNCQLKCPFCFTLEQKPALDTLSSLTTRNLDRVRIIRFTGGEPLLHQEQIDGMIRELHTIESRAPSNLDLIVIQTNAILSERPGIDVLFRFNLPILFEVSLKGTNAREYQYLVHQKPISASQAETIMRKQLKGYEAISSKCASFKRVSVLARLGIFHSSLRKPTFKFVFPDTKDLMFNPANWHPGFGDVLVDQTWIWGDVFERKVVVEKIKTLPTERLGLAEGIAR